MAFKDFKQTSSGKFLHVEKAHLFNIFTDLGWSVEGDQLVKGLGN